MAEQDRVRAYLERQREERGLRQRDLSLMLGLDPVTIGRIERGERTIDLGEWIAIARVLNLDPADMLREALAETAENGNN